MSESPCPPLPSKDKAGLALQASKWLKLPVLVDENEMAALLAALGEYWMFTIGGVIPQGSGCLSQQEFLHAYQEYVQLLKKGKKPEDRAFKRIFSSVFTCSLDALYTVPLPNQQQLIKIDKPVVQLQMHRFDYSSIDGKFRSMVLGPDSISWGIQFSYPQLYQDEQMQIKQVKDEKEFPNTSLFRRLQQWVRHHTIATPFLVDHQLTNVPIRLGKQCLAWINHHPQLAAKGLQVKTK